VKNRKTNKVPIQESSIIPANIYIGGDGRCAGQSWPGKELVNIVDGSKGGPFPKLDLVIDPKAGQVVGLILPARGYISHPGQEIPWTAVKKISTDLILYAKEAVPGK